MHKPIAPVRGSDRSFGVLGVQLRLARFLFAAAAWKDTRSP